MATELDPNFDPSKPLYEQKINNDDLLEKKSRSQKLLEASLGFGSRLGDVREAYNLGASYGLSKQDIDQALGGDLGAGINEVYALANSVNKGNIGGRKAVEMTEGFTRQIRDRLANAFKTQGKALGDEAESGLLDRGIEQIKRREGYLQGQLTTQQDQFNTAVDTRLAGMLNELGFRADTGRKQVGEQMADRGLLRSSFANRAANEVTQAQVADSAQIKADALAQKEQAAQAIDETRAGIQKQRYQAEQFKSLEEVKKFNEIGFQFDQQAIQDQLKMDLAKIELDAQNEVDVAGVIGSILSAGTKLFSGGLF